MCLPSRVLVLCIPVSVMRIAVAMSMRVNMTLVVRAVVRHVRLAVAVASPGAKTVHVAVGVSAFTLARVCLSMVVRRGLTRMGSVSRRARRVHTVCEFFRLVSIPSGTIGWSNLAKSGRLNEKSTG